MSSPDRRLLFIDGRCGAAGDMLLGALIDLGVSVPALRAGLAGLPVEGWRLSARRVDRCGLRVRDARVRDGGVRAADRWASVRRTIRAGSLDPRVRDRALAVFRRLFVAEAAVHGSTPERVHLHEAGSADALIEIVGSCLALERLGWPEVTVSPLTTGFGRVRCAHGTYPVPAPATLELLRGVPVTAGTVEMERVTPTGAALLVELADAWGEMPPMRPIAAGYGAGDRRLEQDPNALRAVLGEPPLAAIARDAPEVVVTTCEIDDDDPQALAHVAERLQEAGALDVSIGAISMKKGRLGQRLTVLSRRDTAAELAALVLRETRTLGVRQRIERRYELERETRRVKTEYGTVRVKLARLAGGGFRAWPEHDDCARLARRHDATLAEVRGAALRQAARFGTRHRKRR